jgi:hypothetical protein
MTPDARADAESMERRAIDCFASAAAYALAAKALWTEAGDADEARKWTNILTAFSIASRYVEPVAAPDVGTSTIQVYGPHTDDRT